MGGRESKLQAKLRAVRERKELAAMEKELSAIEAALVNVATGESLTADEVPSSVVEEVRNFWNIDTEPVDVISDETGPPELAEWMEGHLARQGVGSTCYVSTHLSIKPWIECTQIPGWTRALHTVLPDPVILSHDLSTVVGFIELEYHYAIYAAKVARLWTVSCPWLRTAEMRNSRFDPTTEGL